MLDLFFPVFINLLFFISSWCKTCGDGEGAWSIGFMYGKDPFSLTAPSLDHNDSFPCLRNPVFDCNFVSDVDASFVADPFMFMPNGMYGNWYAFFEVKNIDPTLRRRHGQIGAAVSEDQGQTWSYLGIVLKMPWHLAYPNVFAYKGEIYMLPDARSNLQLYKATEFPLKWQKFRDIHTSDYIDPTLVEWQDTWWMFVNVEQGAYFHLHILFADSPLGPWTGHPNNCVIKSYDKVTKEPDAHTCLGGSHINTHHKTGPLRRNQIGIRSGGGAFVYKNKLYRMVQHSRKVYGDDLDMYEVTRLSKTEPLEEVLVPEFNTNYRKPENIGRWNLGQFHHISMHQVQNNDGEEMWVALTDGNPKFRSPSPAYITETKEQVELFDKQCALGAVKNKTIEQVRLRWDPTKMIAPTPAPTKMKVPVVMTHPVVTATAAVAAATVVQPISAMMPGQETVHRVHITNQVSTRKNEVSPWASPEFVGLDDPAVPANYTDFRASALCFVHAASSSHFEESLAHVKTVREHYPCHAMYIYDLGFTEMEKKILLMYRNVHFLSLRISRPYFEFKACVFKAPMLVDFMQRYDRGEHDCQLAYYGDAHTIVKARFDKAAYFELRRVGLVVEIPTPYCQVEYTHPKMFDWFGYDREVEAKKMRRRNAMMQVQAGLLLIDLTNMTLRNNLWNPWAECCLEAACLSPDNYETHPSSRRPLKIYPLLDGSYIMKTHRDDQSAFTFLIDRLFGRNRQNTRQVYLDPYVKAWWKSAISRMDAIKFTNNKTIFATCEAPGARYFGGIKTTT